MNGLLNLFAVSPSQEREQPNEITPDANWIRILLPSSSLAMQKTRNEEAWQRSGSLPKKKAGELKICVSLNQLCLMQVVVSGAVKIRRVRATGADWFVTKCIHSGESG